MKEILVEAHGSPEQLTFIRPGNLQVKHRLAVGLVFGMEDRKRLGFVLRVQAVLFAGGGVFGVKNSGSPKQDEFHFHNWFARIE